MVLDIPWLHPDELRREADKFLAAKHPSGQPPVPVELIVEQMGIDIVPLPDIKRLFDLVGCTSADCKTVYVDKFVEI